MYGYGGATEAGNGFDRTNYGMAKSEYYPTDVPHCTSLSGLFRWPEGQEVCALEPSAGEGSAIWAVTGSGAYKDIVKMFLVELQEQFAEQAKAKGVFEEVVNDDYTNGVKISHNCFSFCFMNPPYMTDADDSKKRAEKVFLEKTTQNYLKKGAVLVLVVPYRIISDPSYVRYLMRNYDRLGLWRFRESEYKKWGQVAFVGRKKSNPKTPMPEEIQAECSLYYAKEELIPVLPETFEGTPLWRSIEVEPSSSEQVKVFCSQEFDAAAAYELLRAYDLSDYRKIVTKKTTIRPFASKDAGRPPIPPKNDIQYLRAVSGEGQGVTGEEGIDLHLQRGVAEIVEDISYKKNEDGSEVMVSTTHTDITMTLIETNGRITTLK